MDTIKEIVLQDQKDAIKDQDTNYLQQVIEHGCVSGMVSGLIYYTDTESFYKEHHQEINDMLTEMTESTGCSISELFGDKWDNSDSLCFNTQNRNLLAWFAYEETARTILEEQGIEV